MGHKVTTSALAVAFAVVTTGCMIHGQSGYVAPLGGDAQGHEGMAVELRSGVLKSDASGAPHERALGLAVRTKWAKQLLTAAISPELTFLYNHRSPIAPFARLGTNLFQFGNVGPDLQFGMFSPFAEIGAQIGFGEIDMECGWWENPTRKFVSLSVTAEYDLWFTDADNQAYIVALIGIGERGNAADCEEVADEGPNIPSDTH